MSPVFGVIQLIKMRGISSIPKEKSSGHTLDMLSSEKQWPLNGSQLNILAVKEHVTMNANKHALIINMPRVWGAPLDLRHPILISPTGAPVNFGSGKQVDWLLNRLLVLSIN